MKYLAAVFAVLIPFLMSSSLAMKVVMMPNFGPNHYILLEKLGDELRHRGHEVVTVVGSEATYAVGRPNVKVLNIDEDIKSSFNAALKTLFTVSRLSAFASMAIATREITKFQATYCDLTLSDEAVLNELTHADVLIGDAVYQCSALVADKFDLPHVVVAMSLGTSTLKHYGVTHYPAYVPYVMSGIPAKMDLKDRIKNVLMHLGMKLLLSTVQSTDAIFGGIKKKYNITNESFRSVDLVLLTKPFVLDHAQPIPPYVREVGSFMPTPAQPLPAELESFMQSSGDKGVILVSLDYMVDTLEDHVIQEMIAAFSRLPHKVLWRLKPGKFESSLGPDIKAVEWLPQNDILGHNKTKLFITNGDANGVAEAAYHGVPMVCSPMFLDQPDNAQVIMHAGIGEILDVRQTPADKMVSVINKILTDKRYKDNSARVSKVLRLRKHTALQDAADLVEYVQAQDRLDHLKPRSLYLPFYQVYMLDVMAVIGAALVASLALLVCTVRLVIRVCCTKKKKKTS